MFSKTIFHFHAAGISEIGPKLSPFTQLFFKISFFSPDIALRLSEFNPPDGIYLNAKTEIILPNGIEDNFTLYKNHLRLPKNTCTILFVGYVKESKGIFVLLDAVRILLKKCLNFNIKIMGKCESELFEKKLHEYTNKFNISNYIEFLGVLTGEAKHNVYLNADICCFPSFFESESFGLVVVEAMQYCLPVVTTKWRGLQSLIQEGQNGFLVPIKDSQSVADRLSLLIANDDLRLQMGQKGRSIYLEKYSIDIFHKNMDDVFNRF
jgi:glycosyltransferase involved in cell wall biosynthesis